MLVILIAIIVSLLKDNILCVCLFSFLMGLNFPKLLKILPVIDISTIYLIKEVCGILKF